jgi:pimeloyl-ACP methyl ester carboxylesterase
VNRRTVSVGGAGLVVALLALALTPVSPAQAAPGAADCVTSQLRQVSAPGSAQQLMGSVPVVFIHGILSTAAMWDGSSATSIAGQAARMRGATAWTFNYGPWNLDWVTNPAIGPAFAEAVSCLAQSSGHQVVIVAHSMGGLAAQFAVAQPDAYGGMVADHVAEVITIGTPYQGSWLLSAVQALRIGAAWTYPAAYLVAAEAITSECAGSKSGICSLLNVAPSPVGTALELKSTAIKDLSPWPAGLQVYNVAGDIQLVQLVAGSLSSSVDVGDLAVLTDSATAHETTGKSFEEKCGTETLWNLIHGNGGPCYHVNLPSDPDVIQTVVTSIRARVNDGQLPGWTPAKVAPGPVTSVSCSGFLCAAVGAVGAFGQRHGYALTYSGGAWSKPAPLGTGNNYTVSCPSETYCVAVTDTGYAYMLRNNAWSGATDIYPAANTQNGQFSTSDAVKAISCASPSFCVAVTAEGNALTWNGTGWSAPETVGLPGIQPPAPPSALVNAGISCTAATFCLTGTDLQGTAAVWNGTRWSSTTTPVNSALWSVSCASSTFCMIAGGYHAAGDISSIWNGTAWSGLAHPASEGPALGFDQVSCPSSGFCMAIDGGAGVNGELATTTRGTGIFAWSHDSWGSPEAIDSQGALEAISCSAAGLCVAADSSGNVFVDPASDVPAR